jgi:Ca2+-binding EF-hand superfamily protein|tara:strand:+ start:583 stop:1707 length:1125 start_codon:yes stop_codon:yes gene_type:complete
MFSGRISQAVANQIEKKISENNDLNSLSNSELADLAIEFVGDAPPSHVSRETVIEILSQQPEINSWRENLKEKAVNAAKNKISNVASNVDPRMAKMIKQQFGQWLQNSGLTTVEITTKIDTNSDGMVSRDELNSFIQNLSGTQPPEWVSETLISILDKDQNGVIEVQELWDYLGAIGFEVPQINEPVTEEPIIENISESADEADVFEDAEWSDDSEIDIEEEIKQIPDIETIDKTEITITQTEQLETSTVPIDNVENEQMPSITTSIEIGIERLHSTRLHRESVSVIESTESGNCTLMVERVERTLMVMDSYRGGMTVVGLLDNGPYTVAVLFEPEYNEQIESLEGKRISFVGTLFDWSSGLRQAKLKGSQLKL